MALVEFKSPFKRAGFSILDMEFCEVVAVKSIEFEGGTYAEGLDFGSD